MNPHAHAIAVAMADALLAGAWIPSELRRRARDLLGMPPDVDAQLLPREHRRLQLARRRLVYHLVRKVLQQHPRAPHADRSSLAELVLALWQGRDLPEPWDPAHIALRFPFLDPHRMGIRRWGVPSLPTEEDLAARLHLDASDLDWIADRRGWLRREPEGRLQHYQWTWQRKRSGGIRLIEAPKQRLRLIQRWILKEILDPVPPHDAAHGFRKGRSVVSFAAPHVGKDVVIRMDLRDFFPTTRRERVRRLFASLGYPEGVARTLAALCTVQTPATVLHRAPEADNRLIMQRRLAAAHLAQGAPTSPALANLCAFGLDVRLSAFAASYGAAYTRYADDLAFSGGPALAAGVATFLKVVTEIAAEEGWSVNLAKTRVLRKSMRQQLAGVVVNQHPNAPRAEVDRLKAILTNCIRHGPASQNRDGPADFRAHLQGRVAWVGQRNPARGERLRALFDAIPWEPPQPSPPTPQG